MPVSTKIIKQLFFCYLLIGAALSAQAVEFGADASFASSGQVDSWGIASHAQAILDNGYGVDIGYQYLDSITYSALDTTLSHDMSQYEASLLWQTGSKGFRFQALAGGVWANKWVQSTGQDVIAQFSAGYQANVGLSVPVFTRIRAFAELGYQDWFKAEIPSHFRWRYGVRFLLGGNSIVPLESEEMKQRATQEQARAQQLENPSVVIDPDVPDYVPSHLSQSLPPIIANAEICKCFPAGPYTLQLGEFGNMNAAIRGLEYRGLRQFFNSRSYLKSPLPVFFAQAETDGPVGVYLGELSSIEQMQYWRHELRKSGLQARFRKVIGTDGGRVANPIVEMDDSSITMAPKYTEEEIRRMNSLPQDWQEEVQDQQRSYEKEIAEKSEFEQAQLLAQKKLNNVDVPQKFLDAYLQSGPIPYTSLLAVLADEGMKRTLARDPSKNIPEKMSLVWDESKQEAWMSFSQFSSERQVDEWQAWLDASGLTPRRMEKPYIPLGDVYEFELGQSLHEFSVEIARDESIEGIFQMMRSAEVLWFQAYQRINEQNLETTLNWSATDNRYHLIVSGIRSAMERQLIWSNLTAVGLLPSLAEE